MSANLNYVAITGRVQEFLDDVAISNDKSKSVFPASCTVYLYDNNLHKLINFVTLALKKGAGVKVQLEDFKARPKIRGAKWYFVLDDSHPDLIKLDGMNKQIRDAWLPHINVLTTTKTGQKVLDNCVYIKVADTLDEPTKPGEVSILDSFAIFIDTLSKGYYPVVNLNALRPAGTESSNKLIATGVFGVGDPGDREAGSFVSLYQYIFHHLQNGDIISLMQLLGQINSTIRQGRKRKTGIVCTGLHYKHPDIKKYLSFPLHLLVGSQKKAVRIDKDILKDPELTALLIDKVNTESVFLEKTDREFDINSAPFMGTKYKPRLFSNVCEEILLVSQASCLISHVNGGAIRSLEDIVTAMLQSSKFVLDLWRDWRKSVVGADNIFVPQELDNQVGLGWLGFANLLNYFGVTHAEFGVALKVLLDYVSNHIGENKNWKTYGDELLLLDLEDSIVTGGFDTAEVIAAYLYIGYHRAAALGRDYGVERMFTMAPTQTVFTRYKDQLGKTVSRSIDPPFTRRVRRNSEKIGSQWFYHGVLETAAEVGSEVHTLIWNQWQRLMNTTGLAHTMSFDLWEHIDQEWLRWFLNVDPNKEPCYLMTTYYNQADVLDQSYLNKGAVNVATSAVETTPQQCNIEAKGLDCGCTE